MSKLSRLAGLSVLASFAVLAAPATSAFAATDTAPSGADGQAAGPPDQAAGPTTPAFTNSATVVKSTSFAGYSYQGGSSLSGHPVSVTSTFVVPKVTCTTTARAIAPSVGVYRGSTPSSFPSFISAGLFVGCYGGTAHYWPELHIGSTQKNYSLGASDAHPGDVVVVTAHLSTTQSAVTTNNKTRNIIRQLTGAGAQFFASPWVGDDGWLSSVGNPGTLEGVPAFGSLTFTNSLLFNSAFDRQAVAGFNRVTGSGTVQITVGGFFASGKDFSTFFKHA